MTVDDLREHKTQLIAYLLGKVKAGDWHAVQDAASDIREIEAQMQVLIAAGITHDVNTCNLSDAELAGNPALARRIG